MLMVLLLPNRYEIEKEKMIKGINEWIESTEERKINQGIEFNLLILQSEQ